VDSSVLESMPIAQIERHLVARKRKIEVLVKRRDALQTSLEKLNQELGADGGQRIIRRATGRKTKTTSTTTTAKSAGTGALHNKIRDVLKDAKEPMKLADLAAAVLTAGYETKSKSFAVIVGQRLTEMKDVEKVSRGLYALKK